MTTRFTRAHTAVVFWILAAAPVAGVAEPLIPAEGVKAFHAFDKAAQQLQSARAAMAAIEAGQKPQPVDRDFAGVIAGFQTAGHALKRSGAPPLLDASAFGVAPHELKSCTTRRAALDKLKRQLRELRAASQRAGETRALLKTRLDAAQAAEESRQYLVRTATKLSGAPQLAVVFSWSWSDVEGPLGEAIATFANELKRQQDRLDRGNAELKALAANMASEVSDAEGARDCLIAGQWIGAKSQGGAIAGLALDLKSSGSTFAGTANLDGEIVAVKNVSISGSTISITFANGATSMKGSLSADGRSYRGWLSSIEGPASFSLQKQ